MKVKLTEPTISPQNQLYTTIGSTQRVHIGIISNHTNHLQDTVQRNWTLSLNGITTSNGTVVVLLNSFDSYIDLDGLVPNRIYTLTVHNRLSGLDTTASVSTLLGEPTLVDEFYPFREPFEVVGNLEVLGNASTASEQTPAYVRLPVSWQFSSGGSPGFVLVGSKVYAFAPSKILTHDVGQPEVIWYRALPVMPMLSVRVHLLPTILRLSSSVVSVYSVEPRTRLEVKLEFLDSSPGRKYDTLEPVSRLEIRESRRYIVSFTPVY